MNLAIDIGNTRTKLAVFDRDEIICTDATDALTDAYIRRLFRKFSIQKCILSAVSDYHNDIKNFLAANSWLLILDSSTPLPVKNLYKTPLTLGKDRIAAAAGAYALYPNENVLVLDAGTAFTFEFISRRGEYLGGGISPGIRLRLKALNAYTANLPLIEPQSVDFLTGTCTKESILSGVMNGMRLEIEGFIREYTGKYEHLRVLLTGGDAFFFETTLKSKIFAVPNLVLIGLNKILQHNAPSR
ncbi:MAG TPA: type III pantothenate kinase [Chitinophagales bacterium]|nr:type III pantothenate kinase [Chitinophagales bacterium]